MADWVEVARVEDFPSGTVRTVEVDGRPVAVFNLGGRYHAIEDVCSHELQTLSDGKVEGDVVICPLHGARFSIVSGEALTPPAYEPVATFPVRVEAGVVKVIDEQL
jgi:3-phenylpropionate/trans-cinnamate dioxygenase ferredoxin component